ncbi:MAG: thiamine phosphate synthase [Candidatus Latescibacteria bacterium]|nr:thiamine phosphate synthase [bacterium]MBD3424820.1 thiamine phosphate synthase [Candidatus Latescibacterota bacterium]
MNIRFITRATGSEELIGSEDAAVVIDVLRATSCMVQAIESGAERLIPAPGPAEGRELAGNLPAGSTVLAGEKKGRPVEGFDLFNSPAEYTPEAVEGKTVIISTSNGTRAVLAASGAGRVYICSLTNLDAVAGRVRGEKNLVILCSGNQGRICTEDILCGGILLGKLRPIWKDEELEDAARIALLLAEKYADDPYSLLEKSERGRELAAAGYGQDVRDCSMIGTCSTVPVLREGEIVNISSLRPPVPSSPFLYAILDRALISKSKLTSAAGELGEGGADWVQYRAKELSGERKLEEISSIIQLLEESGIPLIVNDDPLLAARSCAAGVHLGSEDPDPRAARRLLGPEAIIGITIHSVKELEEAPLDAVDYISAGSIYPSSTKPSVKAAGTGFIKKLRPMTELPLVVIGGITPDNAGEVIQAGADGIAAASSVLAGDIAKNCFTFRRIIDKNKR